MLVDEPSREGRAVKNEEGVDGGADGTVTAFCTSGLARERTAQEKSNLH